MRIGRWVLLAVLVLMAGAAAEAPGAEFLVRNWSNEEGLPHSRVNSILQTHDGYLWVGTDIGPVRFDGVKFTPFSSVTIPQVDAGSVSKLFEDRGGTLWIALENGRLLSWKDGTVQTHLSGDAGFNRAVVAMAQDAAGTIWVQTSAGQLGRCTSRGIEFEATTGPVPRNASPGLAIDERNTLWVSTGEGLKIREAGVLVTPPGLEALQGRPVEALARGRGRSVWCFQDRQLYQIRAGKVVRRVEVPAEFSGPAVELLESAHQGLWLAGLDGSLFYLSPGGAWQAIPAQSGLQGANPTLCEDAEGNLWRGSAGGGLSQLRTKVVTAFEMPPGLGYSLILAFEGSTNWVRGTATLTLDDVVLRSTTQPVTNYAQDFNCPEATAHSVHWDGGFAYAGAEAEAHSVTNTGVEGSGGLVTSVRVTDGASLGAFTEYWSGTMALPAGANPRNLSLTAEVAGNQTGTPFSFKINDHAGHYIVFNSTVLRPGAFQTVGGLLSSANGIDPAFDFGRKTLDRYALSVCSDRAGNVWMQANSHTLAEIPAGTQTPRAWAGPTVPQPVRTLFSDHANSLWAGTEGGYLYRLREGAFVPVLRVDDKADFISALFEDEQSNLWVGFSSGAGIGLLPAGDPSQWRVVSGLAAPDVRAIAQAADGAMWFGTYNRGASRLQAGRWTHFTKRDGLGSESIRCIHADRDGAVWLGTIHGLYRWKGGKISAIGTEDGLWNDSISHIEEDGRGNFWMSSFGGVFRVAREELNAFADGRLASVQCVGFNRTDGLPSQECAGGFQPAGTRTPEGRLWFPTGGGVVSINPDQVPANKLPPPVLLEEVVVEGAVQPVHSGTTLIETGPGRSHVEFRFTALSLTAPEKVRFRHKLEGLDHGWSKPDERRSAAYSFIPPGRYTFRVMACNNDGLWNPTGAALAISVQPFIWQTLWFKAAAAASLAVLLAWAVRRVERWRAGLRLERLHRKHALERERARISRDIHDDLGASLTQIVFLSEQADSRLTQAEQPWSQRIRTAARNSIRSLDEIVWAVSPKHDTLESLANYLTQFVLEHFGLAGVQCLLEIPTVLPAVELSAEVRHNLLLATREAVQNAVAHARATQARVKLELTQAALEISVSDNGAGFSPAPAEAQGHGLLNMRRRLDQIGGETTFTSRPGSGTTVQFRLPRSRFQAHSQPEPSKASESL